GSWAKIVLPSSTARPVFVVSAGIRGIELSPIFPGALHNAQPSGFGCGSDDHVAIDRIVRRDGTHLLAKFGLARVEIGKNIHLDTVLIISINKQRALREVIATRIIERNPGGELRFDHVIATGSGFTEIGNVLRLAVLVRAHRLSFLGSAWMRVVQVSVWVDDSLMARAIR